MSTKNTKVDPIEAQLAKLKASKGKRAKYDARMHSGTGTIKDVYEGKRGWWVTIATKDHGDVTVRPSQAKLY